MSLQKILRPSWDSNPVVVRLSYHFSHWRRGSGAKASPLIAAQARGVSRLQLFSSHSRFELRNVLRGCETTVSSIIL